MQNCVSEMDFRFSFIRLMEKIIVMTEEVERYIERSHDELLIDVDRDFDYQETAKTLLNLTVDTSKTLRLQLSERNAPQLKDESLMNDEYVKHATNRFIPTEDLESMDDFREDNYNEVLAKAGIHNLIPANNVPIFLKTALRGLHDKMTELGKILDRGDNSRYAEVYDQTFSDLRIAATCNRHSDSFEEWRDEHDACVNDEKWKDKLKEHIQICMTALFESGFFDYYELAMTEDDKETHTCQFRKHKKLDEKHLTQYLALCEFVETTFNKKSELDYKPNKKRIGRYLYKQRRNIDGTKVEAFLKYLAMLELHKKALAEKVEKKALNHFAPKKAFITLLTESTWMGRVLRDGLNNNYLENFVDALMESKHKDWIAETWSKQASRDKLKCQLLGALMNAGVLTGTGAQIARFYAGKKDGDAGNYGDYVNEGKNYKKCKFSEWVYDYVNPR